MSNVNAQFSGNVVAEPERKDVGGGLLTFPVYINDQKKVDGEYVDTGNVTKIRVNLWGDLADEDIRKGDIVEVEGSIVEREYDKNDGTKGRSLETKFVNSIVVKWRKPGEAVAASAVVAGAGEVGF